jgi:hypothetical protein
MIGDRVITDITHAELVVAGLTDLNPNALYELGIRHSTEKPTIHVARSATQLPFDNVSHRTIFIDLTDWQSIVRGREHLAASARAIKEADYQVSNPITQANASFKMRQSADPRDRIISELQERIAAVEHMPRLRAFYDPKVNSCRSVSQFSTGSTQFDAMCYRLRVENIGEYPATGCEGHLTEVYYEGESPELGTMSLIWAGTWPEPSNIDIFPGIPRDLGVIYISERNQITVCTEGYGWPLNQQNFFSRTGKYYFKIQIAGRNTAKIAPCLLELAFTGDWKTSTMRTA